MIRLSILEMVKIKMWCNACKQWVVAQKGKSYLPIHNNPKNPKSRKKCLNSNYNYDKLEYFVVTPQEAIAVAKFIKDDKGGCFENDGGLHSLNCGDGENCDKERLLLSKALANYYLETQV